MKKRQENKLFCHTNEKVYLPNPTGKNKTHVPLH